MNADRLSLPFSPDFDPHLSKLYVAAELTCGFSVAEEVAGTNGLGTALEEGRPAAIQGSEHFADQFVGAWSSSWIPRRWRR